MCGIVAIQAIDHSVTEDRLRRAISTLTHRGPDHSGVWVSPRRDAGLATCEAFDY